MRRQCCFKAPLIGTEHILIAMIKNGKCTAARLLNTMNVNIQKLYVDLLNAMGDDAPADRDGVNWERRRKRRGKLRIWITSAAT